MSKRLTLRRSALATLTAMSAFAAQAIEATQWNPQDDAPQTASTEASSATSTWTVQNGEATQFRDARSEDSMLSRATVREELQQAGSEGLLNDTGEAGATERVLAQREAFAAAEHERLVALNSPASEDPIAAIADVTQAPGRDAPLPYESSVTPLAMAPLSDDESQADVAAV